MRLALCTGVSGSVGFEVAKRFLERFSDVQLIGTFNKDPRDAASLQTNPNFTLERLDLRTPETWTLPKNIDYLINCAGCSSGKALVADVPLEEWEELVAVNLRAPFLLAKHVLPHMVGQAFGRIVGINSIWGLRGSQRNAAYIASKHGLSGLMKAIAKDYGASGVVANEVCPGPIESRMMDGIAARLARESGTSVTEMGQRLRDTVNSKKFATPGQVADAALFLCGDDAGHMNGASLVLDGGIIC